MRNLNLITVNKVWQTQITRELLSSLFLKSIKIFKQTKSFCLKIDDEGPTVQKPALGFTKAINGHRVTSNRVQG